MSAILEGTPDKRLVLVTGRAYPELAEKVAECLGTEILETTSYDFANGEMYVRFTEPVRGADVFVLQCHSGDINKWIDQHHRGPRRHQVRRGAHRPVHRLQGRGVRGRRTS